MNLGPRYDVLRELGSGGMGRVFLVKDRHLRQEVALKVLHAPPNDPDGMRQAQQEFTVLAQIEHANIARAFDFGFLGEIPYFTSEYISGRTLEDPGRSLGVVELILIARSVAAAMECLHRSDTLHLDIKPSNIITTAAAHRRAVLIDFGLCRRATGAAPFGPARGSLPYMAPEYFLGGEIGSWTDVYAFGVTLYRASTGRYPRPIGAGSIGSLNDSSVWLPSPTPPSQIRADLPPELDHVILDCLALDPGSRCASPARLLDQVRPARADGCGSTSVTIPPSKILPATIGRDQELEKVGRFLDSFATTGVVSTDEHVPALVVAGVGRSHFLREVKLLAQTRGFLTYFERGYPQQARPVGTLLRCLTAHIGDAEARERWHSFLTRLDRPAKNRASRQGDACQAEVRLRRANELTTASVSVSEPLVLVVDDLQHFDEISVSMVVDFVRSVKAGGDRRPNVRCVLTYKEEGPAARFLEELTEAVLEAAPEQLITLKAFDVQESLSLFERFAGRVAAGGFEGDCDALSGLRLFEASQGNPVRILELASEVRQTPDPQEPAEPGHVGETIDRLSQHEASVLLALQVFGRPTEARELQEVVGEASSQLRRCLESLRAKDLVERRDSESSRFCWCVLPTASLMLRGVAGSRRRTFHRRIARKLANDVKPLDGRMVEAFHHADAAGSSTVVVRYGVAAAEYLMSRHQNGKALAVLERVLKAIPARQGALRIRVGLQAAELHARVGRFESGIHVLTDLLSHSPPAKGVARLRIVLNLAVLHSRRGEFKRAAGLFEEYLPRQGAPRGLEDEEVLHFVNEFAVLRGFTGDYDEALRLCERGLDLARRSRSRSTRSVVLDLHSTRATVALRTFNFSEAIRHFDKALEIAESLGSQTNRAVVLNNLGIVYSQCDRYVEAIRAFEEAERTCQRLDEGPSLVSIYGNLAVLYSKRGDFSHMESALEQAKRLTPDSMSDRQGMFLRHARGLSFLNTGRYSEARSNFETAARLASEMGDGHLAAFDRIYLGETLIFQGEYGEAARLLQEFSSSPHPARCRAMALARLAFLFALTAQYDEAQRCAVQHSEERPERPIPFLDAWDGLFLGWAASVRGDFQGCWTALEPAESFFRSHDLQPALSLAMWIRLEAFLLNGDVESVKSGLVERTGGNRLTDALWPLLEARVLLQSKGSERRCADLLSESGRALIGNPLPEWEACLYRLRAAMQRTGGRVRRHRRLREKLALGLPSEVRKIYTRSRYWQTWTRVRAFRPSSSKGKADDGRAAEQKTASIVRDNSSSRRSLIALSPAMLRIVSELDRLRSSDAPVLVQGETGTGKEYVARILHAESSRASGPFEIVSCATIPPELLEAELFGAMAGSFTGMETDRMGLLERAHGGTVLLDDISGITLEMQAKLLRVLSSKSVRPLGAATEREIDVRFLFTTSSDLVRDVECGRLREDVYHRVCVLTLTVPPLRERPEDIPGLVRLILAELTGDSGRAPPTIASTVIEQLRRREWPGNVRELRNLLVRLRVESPEQIDMVALERVSSGGDTHRFFPGNLLEGQPLDALKERLERDYLVYHFERLDGDTQALLEFLGFGRRQLYRKCQRLGISLRALRRPTR